MAERLSDLGAATSLEPSLASLVGLPAWLVIVLALGGVATLLWRLPSAPRTVGQWPWVATGVGLGLLGVVAWVAGAFAGWAWGLSMTGPSRSLLEALLRASAEPLNWGAVMLMGLPLGSWASARLAGPVAWRPVAASELSPRFLGGALMGVGGTLAAGCNIGNALTGLSILSVNSIIATLGIAVGGASAVWLSRRTPPHAVRP